jgi:UDP-glucose:(heptosyl)LPS alpha-1,3-glucosyltransferase
VRRLGVLFDRWRPAAGGAEAHTDALVRRAVETGVEVVLATLEGAAEPPVRTITVRAPSRRPARDRAFAVAGTKALRDAGCDVVYAVRHAPGCDVVLPHGGLVADAIHRRDAARGRRPGALRTLLRALSGKTRWFLEAERAMLGGARGPRVVAVSGLVLQRIAETYPAARSRTVVVWNGVDAARFDPARFAEGRAALRGAHGLAHAYVGLLLAMDPVLKGVESAVRALAEPRVLALDPAFHLVVAGGRVPARVRRLARRLGVATRLHVLPPLADPRPWLAAADVLVHPTWYDPCSLACLEALAMGLPVITTPWNGVKEVMGPKGGIVVEEAGLPEAVAVAVGVLADPVLRRLTGEDARWLATRNPLRRRLDEVLDVCRGKDLERDTSGDAWEAPA